MKILDTEHGTRIYDPETARTLLLHVDNLFYQRVNIFLIAESIFFAAFAVLGSQDHTALATLMCSAGIVFAVVLRYTLLRLETGLRWLVGIYRRLEEPSDLYEDYTQVGYHSLHSTFIYVWVVPTLTVLFWVLALLLTNGVLQ